MVLGLAGLASTAFVGVAVPVVGDWLARRRERKAATIELLAAVRLVGGEMVRAEAWAAGVLQSRQWSESLAFGAPKLEMWEANRGTLARSLLFSPSEWDNLSHAHGVLGYIASRLRAEGVVGNLVTEPYASVLRDASTKLLAAQESFRRLEIRLTAAAGKL